MGKLIDLTGQRFGRLVVERLEKTVKGRGAYWRCRCDCGAEVVVWGWLLRCGNIVSCGCYRKEVIGERSKGNAYHKTHGLSRARLYRIYRAMLRRCYVPTAGNYSQYGGRGISVCAEWRTDINAFFEWALAHGYDDTKSIDRIDVDGNYEPENCRWADNSTQSFNRGLSSRNHSGHTGVKRLKNGRYAASICKDRRTRYLGTFDTFEEAVAARTVAEKELYS